MKKKGMIAVIITVIALFLVAAVLATVLVVRTVRQLEDSWDSRYEDREDEEEEDEDEERPARRDEDDAVAEAPAVEVPTEAVPMEGGSVALIIPDNGDFSVLMRDSFAETCAKIGLEATIHMTGGSPEEAFEVAMVMMESGVEAIAVSCPEPGLLEELSMIAMEMGVVLVSLDVQEDVYMDIPVMLRIEAWGSSTDIGYALLSFMAYGIGYEGNFGVVSPMENDPVFDAMEEYMMFSDEVTHTVWKASSHGNGSFDSCYESAIYLLERYDLDALVCTDPMSTQAAAQAITECGFDVELYGFAPPSAVEAFMTEGLILYHNPLEMGELTARALAGILNGTLTLEEGGSLDLANGMTYWLYLFDGILDFNVPYLYIDKESINELATWY